MAMRPPSDVDPMEFDSLNDEFYRADPATVIEHRVWMLAQFMADEALEGGREPGIKLTRDEVPADEERVQFAVLESTMILHQAAETLLRLCLAHWGNAACPWFEMAKLRQPRVFPAKVAHLARTIMTDETMNELLEIVSWSADRASIESTVTWKRAGGWERHHAGLQEIIRRACDIITEGAELDNAGKHGLAILPSHRGVTLGDGELISASGPALTVIEREEQQGELRWAKVTHWVKYEEAVVLTALMVTAIRSLWACAKQRRVGDGDQSHIQFFDIDVVEKIRVGAWRYGVHVNRMSWILFDEEHPMFTPTPPNGPAHPMGGVPDDSPEGVSDTQPHG